MLQPTTDQITVNKIVDKINKHWAGKKDSKGIIVNAYLNYTKSKTDARRIDTRTHAHQIRSVLIVSGQCNICTTHEQRTMVLSVELDGNAALVGRTPQTIISRAWYPLIIIFYVSVKPQVVRFRSKTADDDEKQQSTIKLNFAPSTKV